MSEAKISGLRCVRSKTVEHTTSDGIIYYFPLLQCPCCGTPSSDTEHCDLIFETGG